MRRLVVGPGVLNTARPPLGDAVDELMNGVAASGSRPVIVTTRSGVQSTAGPGVTVSWPRHVDEAMAGV